MRRRGRRRRRRICGGARRSTARRRRRTSFSWNRRSRRSSRSLLRRRGSSFVCMTWRAQNSVWVWECCDVTVSNGVLFERQQIKLINHHHHQPSRPQAVSALGPDAAVEVPQPTGRGRWSYSDASRFIFWLYACIIFHDTVSLPRRAHPKPLALSDANPGQKYG